MIGVNESARFTRQHGAVASRLTGIATSLFFERPVLLADAADPKSSHEGRTIVIERSDTASIALVGKGGHLTYSDPGHETTIAALVAMLCANGGPVAADPVSLAVIALADRLAQTDIPVLIHGPTGTGKEVLSKFIHQRSARADQPFIAVNCAAIPETMLEALLFGHEKGAFTGANATGEGFFRAADGGTLLLDEIAEMPLSLQAKLLRALQEGEVVPIGATTPVKVDVRVIACANRDLPGEVAAGRFREDLFYRLNVFPMTLAPLAERTGDIAPLAFAMILRHRTKGQAIPWLSEAALATLKAHKWPGNVRELENVIRRALLLSSGKDSIANEHIVFDTPVRSVAAQERAEPQTQAPVYQGVYEVPPSGARRLSKIVRESEANAIMQTLDACNGRRAEAAKQLGISERTLRYRLASFREAGIAVGGAR
ncbi:Fis family transcriptional regulator [Citromicrobium sp. RCC1885]|uniref:sigma-54 interaction domain-containing protein n=1 Tax=unclassified Citromicrobium TaxID=2630544 RepID=UPI0006C93AFD|nr:MULTISPECIES: sigma-54-dependent Fis family transcriptional regulator [unclassified Citromicrobium]KPM24604.1 Fis family transcriptional regulator [Citromicrobium sp. RCC1885]KPM27846.1 Fis family transcriptional regulator [Citromicrobium sp. RCC1878]OAM10655.1 sigma-54-dependent Fis family transcriptional regulator [Citromicrobium sp. RCC1897]|tara:strand:+ start:4717 stop:6003 length:1287 start_codon:yes stop_codon:yes gene_type:complete